VTTPFVGGQPKGGERVPLSFEWKPVTDECAPVTRYRALALRDVRQARPRRCPPCGRPAPLVPSSRPRPRLSRRGEIRYHQGHDFLPLRPCGRCRSRSRQSGFDQE